MKEANEKTNRSNHQLVQLSTNPAAPPPPTSGVYLFQGNGVPPTTQPLGDFGSKQPLPTQYPFVLTAYHGVLLRFNPTDAILIVVVNLFLGKRIYV